MWMRVPSTAKNVSVPANPSPLPHVVDPLPRFATDRVLTVALLASAVTTPISGRLGDILGKRNVTLVMLLVLIAGSLIAGLSQELPWVLVGRGLQGASIGIVPVGISILGDLPEPQLRVVGIAYMSGSLGFGGAIGLPMGGWIVTVGHWSMLFWFSLALGVVNIILVWVVVPRDTGTGARLDIPGSIGLAIGLSAILIAVSQGPNRGWVSLPTIGRRPLLLVNLGSISPSR